MPGTMFSTIYTYVYFLITSVAFYIHCMNRRTETQRDFKKLLQGQAVSEEDFLMPGCAVSGTLKRLSHDKDSFFPFLVGSEYLNYIHFSLLKAYYCYQIQNFLYMASLLALQRPRTQQSF